MDEGISQPVTCRVFREQLFLFQTDEMSEGDRAVLQEHLNLCQACAGHLELEDRLLASLKETLPREPAPAGLESRIRQALSDATLTASAADPVLLERSWWKDPIVAAIAAVFLLAALVAPVLMDHNIVAEPAVYTGTIVDYQCDQEGLSLEMQRNCMSRSHVNALKLDDGSYVHFNNHQADYRNILSDVDVRGHRVTVHGSLHPEIQTLEVVGVEELSGRL